MHELSTQISTLTFRLFRQVCFSNILMLISETVNSLGLLSILACAFFPPPLTRYLPIPHKSISHPWLSFQYWDLPVLPYVLIVPFSELLLSLASNQNLIDVDVNFPETHWAGRGITKHLVQPLCFIVKLYSREGGHLTKDHSERVAKLGQRSWLLDF